MVSSRGPPHCNDHRNGQQSGFIFLRWFFVCCHGGCGSNMEQVVARWQCPVASGVALNMLLGCICRHRSTWPCHIRSASCCSQCFLLRRGQGVLTVLQRNDRHWDIQSFSLARMCGKWRTVSGVGLWICWTFKWARVNLSWAHEMSESFLSGSIEFLDYYAQLEILS